MVRSSQIQGRGMIRICCIGWIRLMKLKENYYFIKKIICYLSFLKVLCEEETEILIKLLNKGKWLDDEMVNSRGFKNNKIKILRKWIGFIKK